MSEGTAPPSSWQSKLIKILRVSGGICGCLCLGLGIFDFVTFTLTPRGFITALYLCIFGVLMIIAELRIRYLLQWFVFLTHFFGLGLYYIFVGGLALGGAWYMIALAVGCLSVGIMYAFMGCLCKSMENDDAHTNKKQNDQAEQAYAVYNAAQSLPPGTVTAAVNTAQTVSAAVPPGAYESAYSAYAAPQSAYDHKPAREMSSQPQHSNPFD